MNVLWKYPERIRSSEYDGRKKSFRIIDHLFDSAKLVSFYIRAGRHR
jgi:hypothetical protein